LLGSVARTPHAPLGRRSVFCCTCFAGIWSGICCAYNTIGCGCLTCILLLWAILAGGVWFVAAFLLLGLLFLTCYSVAVLVAVITELPGIRDCHPGVHYGAEITYSDVSSDRGVDPSKICSPEAMMAFGEDAFSTPYATVKILFSNKTPAQRLIAVTERTINKDFLGKEDGYVPLLKGKPKWPPMAVTNPVFAFVLGIFALSIVAAMNSYVDTWATSYVAKISYNEDGSIDTTVLDMMPPVGGYDAVWEGVWGAWASTNGIIRFAYIDAWPMLPPVLAELFSFDQVKNIWAQAGFSGSVPALTAAYFMEMVLQVRFLSSLFAGLALGFAGK